jgi:mRNA interferase RelE/StbE
MSFEILWKESAIKELEKFEKGLASRIFKKVGELNNEIFSKDVKKVKGTSLFRLRVGDYRILFEIEKNKILINKIVHRKNIYKR